VDIFPASMQRPPILEFHAALNVGAARLRRDDCGDWVISGRCGHIYAAPEGFTIMVNAQERSRRWGFVKRWLSFCRLTNDGDDEGAFVLDRLPSEAEAALLRDALKIKKSPSLSSEQRERLIQHLAGFKPQNAARSQAALSL